MCLAYLRLTDFAPWTTPPAFMKTEEVTRVTGINHKGRVDRIDDAAILPMIDRLEETYRGFPWESRVWQKDGVRRSPY